MALRALRAAAAVEALSLLVLLLNLVTGHNAAVASAVGPIHGCAYLIAIVTTWSLTKARSTRAISFIPGIGALMVLRFSPGVKNLVDKGPV